jgi:cysteine desulfurase
VIEVLPGIMEKLRALSPFWTGAQENRGEFKPVYA